MRETARLAGFFAAHGIWSIAGGGTLTPLLGYEQPDGGRGMDRFAAEDTAEAVHTGQDALQANRRGSVRAVLVTDAYIELGTGRSDALIVEAVEIQRRQAVDDDGHTVPPAIIPARLCRVPAQVHRGHRRR